MDKKNDDELRELVAAQVATIYRLEKSLAQSQASYGTLAMELAAAKANAAPQQHAQAALSDEPQGIVFAHPDSQKLKPLVVDWYRASFMDDGKQWRAITQYVLSLTRAQQKITWDHARAILAASQQPAAAPSGHVDVDKMLETNQLDELGAEVARLQAALCFWLPSVTDREDEVALRILNDAFLLVGIDGNLPGDFKSAQELGWVSLAAAPSPVQREVNDDPFADDDGAAIAKSIARNAAKKGDPA